MKDPTFEEIQKILNDDDIERLTKGILLTLKDMSDSLSENDVKLYQIYDKMGLNAYHRKVVDYICEKYLLPNNLIRLQDNRVQITNEGLNRVSQIEKTDAFLWKETLDRLERSRAEYSKSKVDQNWSDTYSGQLEGLRFSLEKISKTLASLDYIDVITVKGSDGLLRTNPKEFDISNLKEISGDIVFRTRIELDGDIIHIMPDDPNIIANKEIFNLHKENMEISIGSWNEMVNTILKVIKELSSTNKDYYGRSIGDKQNIIGNILDNGFEINLSKMETGKQYSFQFEQTSYSVTKNEKGELDLYEISELST